MSCAETKPHKFIKLFIFSIFVFLGGCSVFGQRISRLQEGMTKAEVIDTIGQPDGFQRKGEYTSFKYTHRFINNDPSNRDRADYVVILKNDKVIEWGAGEVRVKEEVNNTGVLFLVPLRY